MHEQAAPLYLAQLNLTPRTVSGGYIMSKATLEKKNLLGVYLQFQEVVFDHHGKEYDTSRQGIEAVVDNLSSSSVGSRVRERETCET